jgi:hypothetical protein
MGCNYEPDVRHCTDGVHLLSAYGLIYPFNNPPAFMPHNIFRRSSLTSPVTIAQIQRNRMPTYINRRLTFYISTA